LTLGLFAAVIALVALTAAGAQAEENALWLIVDEKDKHTYEAGELHASIGVTLENNDGSLLTKILNVNIKILCTSVEIIGGALLGQGTISEGKLKFSGCDTFLNGVKSAPCKPKTAGMPAGTILTNWLTGLLVLHILKPSGIKDDLVKIEPSEGLALANILTGEECMVGEAITVNGTVFLKDCTNALLNRQVTHLFEQGPLTDLWVSSKSKEPPETSLDGSALVFLTGAHFGLDWAGEPA
jgi:hypothetical protein